MTTIMTILKSSILAAPRLIDKLYDYLGTQPLLNKMLRTHHVDIHQSLEELKQSVEELKPKPTDYTFWQRQFHSQVDKNKLKVQSALKTTLALEDDPDESLLEDYLFFLLWRHTDKAEFTEQGVKNFEEYLAQTSSKQE